MSSECRKSLMGLAAIMVLIFHFYIPVTTSLPEMFLQRAAYIGVDIFFLASAYSLGKRKDLKYLSFIKNRLILVYVPFVISCVIAKFYLKWDIKRTIFAMIGKEFFERGGGSFLWYIPGIMILYLISPLFFYAKRKFGLYGIAMILAGWVAVAAILQFGFDYTKINILINRIPIFVIGLYFDELIGKYKQTPRIIAGVVGVVVGAFLIYKYGLTTRLSKPFAEMFYVIALVFTVAIVNLFVILGNKYKLRVLNFIGKITLEIYCLQMIFGFDIEIKLHSLVGYRIPTFLLTSLVLMAMAFVLHYILSKSIYKLIGGKRK